MIAYVQEFSCSHWLDCVNGWIQALSMNPSSTWSESDVLKPLNDNVAKGVCILSSQHRRKSDLADCKLRHLWIAMN
jgi:hypothetical protein